jgi:hypothetical protein
MQCVAQFQLILAIILAIIQLIILAIIQLIIQLIILAIILVQAQALLTAFLIKLVKNDIVRRPKALGDTIHLKSANVIATLLANSCWCCIHHSRRISCRVDGNEHLH